MARYVARYVVRPTVPGSPEAFAVVKVKGRPTDTEGKTETVVALGELVVGWPAWGDFGQHGARFSLETRFEGRRT